MQGGGSREALPACLLPALESRSCCLGAGMDMMLLVQGACCSNQWLAAVLLSLCCLLPSCLPAGQSVDFPGAAVDNLVVRKGDTAVLR